MDVKSLSGFLTLLGVFGLAAIFLYVYFRAKERRDYVPVQGTAYRIRAIGFWILVLVGLPISIWLLRVTPYVTTAAASQVVNATGYQWYWELDRTSVIAGEPVEFRVTSVDVNHGFGLYDENSELVAQTQAMPGYVNRLTYVFQTPGTYRILCLEYCGVAHHDMTGEIKVTAGGSNG